MNGLDPVLCRLSAMPHLAESAAKSGALAAAQSALRLYQMHPERKRSVFRALLTADTAVISLIFLIVVHMHRWWESPFVAVLSCLAAVLLLATCLFPADIGLKAEA